MSTILIFGIALALAMDAFAVSVAGGVTALTGDWRPTLRLAWHFGFFQAAMTTLGWAVGLTFRALIENADHWLAFGLLAFVGGRMIYQSWRSAAPESRADPTKGLTLVMLSVATSVDALAVGLSLSMLNVQIVKPALIIGAVAAVATIIGMRIGRALGERAWLRKWAEFAGGVVLIAIGANILRGHGVF